MGTGEFLRITQADRAPTRLSTVTPGGSKSQPPSPRTDPAPPTHSAAQPARLPAPISRCRGHRTSQRRVPQAQLPPTHRGRAASLPPSSQVRLLKARCFPPPPPAAGWGGTSVSCQALGLQEGETGRHPGSLTPSPPPVPNPQHAAYSPPRSKSSPPRFCSPAPLSPATPNILLLPAQPRPLALGSHPHQGSLPSCFEVPVLPAGPRRAPRLCAPSWCRGHAPSRPAGGEHPAAGTQLLSSGPHRLVQGLRQGRFSKPYGARRRSSLGF